MYQSIFVIQDNRCLVSENNERRNNLIVVSIKPCYHPKHAMSPKTVVRTNYEFRIDTLTPLDNMRNKNNAHLINKLKQLSDIITYCLYVRVLLFQLFRIEAANPLHTVIYALVHCIRSCFQPPNLNQQNGLTLEKNVTSR